MGLWFSPFNLPASFFLFGSHGFFAFCGGVVMTVFINNLNLIWSFLLDTMTKLFNLYTSSPVLIAVFALWVLDRIFHIFDFIKG